MFARRLRTVFVLCTSFLFPSPPLSVAALPRARRPLAPPLSRTTRRPSSFLAAPAPPSFRRRRARTTTTAASASALPPLVEPDGTPLSPEAAAARLAGSRVALYFAAGWCPMCTSFEPSLLRFREAAAQSGKPVELVYVGSDRDEEERIRRTAAMDAICVAPEAAAEVKRRYKIWAGAECFTFGMGRRSGVPALVVLDAAGDELEFLAAEAQGVRSLQSWPIDDERGIWGR